MNRKERRRLRRYGNRQNYLRNRRRWCPVGPPVVMDDPTEEHVKALLMEWIGPRIVLEEVTKELAQRETQTLESKFYQLLSSLGGGEITVADMPVSDLWRHLVYGATVRPPP